MKTKRRESTTTRGWKLRLLGEPALISRRGEEHLLERRAAALLALAALDPGITRRKAARMLWPDSSEANARQALRQQLLRMRKLAGGELLEAGEALRLAAGVSADVGEATAAGALLGSFEYADEEELAQWLGRERERRHAALVAHFEAAMSTAESERDFTAAIALAQRLIAADEGNERHHRALMRLHYLSGDVAQAQGAYQRLRDMLVREFAAEPSAETEQLVRTLRSAGSEVVAGGRSVPASVIRPPRLVGRERAWQALQDAWSDGSGTVVSGVAGIGKTRLVAEFTETRGSIVMVGARPGDSFAPYSLLARIARAFLDRFGAAIGAGVRRQLAALLPELGAAPPMRDAAERGRMLRAVESLISVSVAEGIAGIVIDDLHYADAASLEALQGQVAPGGLRVIVTFRGDEVSAPGRALADAILLAGNTSEIALDALGAAHVAELIDSLHLWPLQGVHLGARIARHTGGNPLFVLETVKAIALDAAAADGSAPLPVAANVREMIARRLAKLSDRSLALARCAAVAGQDFSAELAAHVMGVRPIDLADAWAELERVHVFRDGVFDHDLVHEAALGSVPAAIARRLHAEIAAFLDAAGIEPARVAQHWIAARRPKEGGAALVRAASRARDAGRRSEEAFLLEQAADCLQKAGDGETRFEALLARAEAMLCDDLGDRTRTAVAAAKAAAATDEQRVRALLQEAQYLSNRSESEEAVRIGSEGGRLADRMGRPDLAVHFAAIVAGGLCELRRVDEALSFLDPYRSAVGDLPPRVAIEFLVQLGIVLDLHSRLGEALEAFESARRMSAEHGLKDLLASALSNLATTTSKRGGISPAVDYGREALRLWREAEPLKGVPMQTQVLLAHRLRDIGHYDEAIPMLEEALDEFRRVNARSWIFSAAHRLALAYSHVGQHARAIKLLADEPTGLPLKARAIWEAHRGEVARFAGGEALAPVRSALALLGQEIDDSNNRLVAMFASAVLPHAEAESMAAAVAAWAAAHERFGMAIAGHARASACALAQGAVDRSVSQAEAAMRLALDHEPDNFYRPELWWIAAQSFRAAGRDLEADRLLEKARRWILDVAENHVRSEYRDSFLHRNPVNRALLSASRRRLPSP